MLLEFVIVFLASAAVASAIKVHDFFEGETLVRDCIDEYQLSRKSLKDLDIFCSEHNLRCDAIISMTSIPSRLPFIAPTLKSLMRQSVSVRKIVLNLPRFSKREKAVYSIPEFLNDLKSVEINWCDDLGPATKLLPSLARENSGTKIIVVDDDRIYPPNMVRDLVAAADRHPTSAFGLSGWVVPEDFTDRPTTIWSNLRKLPPAPVRARRLKHPMQVDILQGASGYVVRPSLFDVIEVVNYRNAPEQAYFVDDVWISAHCNANRFVIPSRRYNYQPKLFRKFYRKTSLGLLNRGPGPDEERNNTVVIRHFRNRWITSRDQQPR